VRAFSFTLPLSLSPLSPLLSLPSSFSFLLSLFLLLSSSHPLTFSLVSCASGLFHSLAPHSLTHSPLLVRSLARSYITCVCDCVCVCGCVWNNRAHMSSMTESVTMSNHRPSSITHHSSTQHCTKLQCDIMLALRKNDRHITLSVMCEHATLGTVITCTCISS